MKHIAIAGNIGSGKTILTTMLAKYYGCNSKLEVVDTNPYIDDYYKDIKRWSFQMEIFFLKERFKTLIQIAKDNVNVIQDRTIYEGVYVFTANNYAMGNLEDRDYNTYMELFQTMNDVLRLPDLMIYLKSSVSHLVDNIEKRGREYEQKMPLNYLDNINKRYDNFIVNEYKGRVLTIEIDNLDFKNNPKDFSYIIERIDRELFGLFPYDNKKK